VSSPVIVLVDRAGQAALPPPFSEVIYRTFVSDAIFKKNAVRLGFLLHKRVLPRRMTNPTLP